MSHEKSVDSSLCCVLVLKLKGSELLKVNLRWDFDLGPFILSFK